MGLGSVGVREGVLGVVGGCVWSGRGLRVGI